MNNQTVLTDRQQSFNSKIKHLMDQVPDGSTLHSQLNNHKEIFSDSTNYLLNPEHRLAFIGNIGTGKTTAICHLLGLLDDGEPILSTGSGRTTLCEVELRHGEKLQINVIPHSEAEVSSYLNDFALYLMTDNDSQAANNDSSEGFKLSAEIDRALRNMLSLRIHRFKNEQGKRERNDSAKDFAREFSDTTALCDALIERIDLPSRVQTLFEPNHDIPQNQWLHETFKSINNGIAENAGLAKRIVISIPDPLFKQNMDFSLAVVDTKGVDETVNRQDLDRCLTDRRTISVLCSKLPDAPDKTMSALLRSAKQAGLSHRISHETVLLVLDRKGEAAAITDVDGPVGDKIEGREVRQDQMEADFNQSLHLNDLDIQFLDVQADDTEKLSTTLIEKIQNLRAAHYDRLTEIETAVKEIAIDIQSKATAEAQKQVRNTLKPWLEKALSRSPELKEYFLPLVHAIRDKGTYAASVRASVNRNGEWHNLDFYQNLASGAREQVVSQIGQIYSELLTLLNNMLEQAELKPAHSLIKQIKHTSEKRLGDLYEQVFAKGRSVYEDSLKKDRTLWHQLYAEWGQGSGYKDRIADGSQNWFHSKHYPKFERQVSGKAIDAWQRYITEFQSMLGND